MELVRHETCQQYVERRLSEGWQIAGSWRHLVFLSPPDSNFIRVVDLRNDVETLRPSAPGDDTNLTIAGAATNWECVDEVVKDDHATNVWEYQVGYLRDLYNLQDHSVGSGTINFVKVYAWFHCGYSPNESNDRPSAMIYLKSGGVLGAGSQISVPKSWILRSYQRDTPPEGGDWDWDKIDALQAGIAVRSAWSGGAGSTVNCTQVYVEVDYTLPAVAENKSANMGSKMVVAGLI